MQSSAVLLTGPSHATWGRRCWRGACLAEVQGEGDGVHAAALLRVLHALVEGQASQLAAAQSFFRRHIAVDPEEAELQPSADLLGAVLGEVALAFRWRCAAWEE
jgi:hypothetical protein